MLLIEAHAASQLTEEAKEMRQVAAGLPSARDAVPSTAALRLWVDRLVHLKDDFASQFLACVTQR